MVSIAIYGEDNGPSQLAPSQLRGSATTGLPGRTAFAAAPRVHSRFGLSAGIGSNAEGCQKAPEEPRCGSAAEHLQRSATG